MAYIAAQLGRLSLHPEVSGLSKNVSVSTSRRKKSKSSQQKQPGPVQTCGRRIVCSNAASLLVGSEKSTVSKHYKSRSYAKVRLILCLQWIFSPGESVASCTDYFSCALLQSYALVWIAEKRGHSS